MPGLVANGWSWFSITGVVSFASGCNAFSAGPRSLANGWSCFSAGPLTEANRWTLPSVELVCCERSRQQ